MTAARTSAMDRGHSPRFSVVINVYNGEAFLRETIDSVISQSFTDWELILWDDGSTDGSEEICREYAGDRVHYFRAPQNAGIGAARDAAVRGAAGEWLAFLDQDDIWLPHKLATQSALIDGDETGRLGLVYGRTNRFEQSGRTAPFDGWHGLGRLPQGDIFAQLLRMASFIAFSSTLIRRDAFLELGPIPADIVYCPDYYLCVAIARRYASACVQEVCCLYRVHPSSMSHVYRKQIFEEALHIIEKFAGPGQRHILRTQRWIHQSLIGVDEMHADNTRWQGAWRILRHGSLLYLLYLAAVLSARELRHRMLRSGGKYRLLQTIRSLGLLKWVDRVRFVEHRLLHHRRNARFIRQHREFPVPPADLAFDAYNHADWAQYSSSGLAHATAYAEIIRQNAPEGPLTDGPLAILEWGCGPGRIIRHLRHCLAELPVTLTGTDNNGRTIDWCRAQLSGIEFAVNSDKPPMAFADGQFDVIYNFSVFTHLSEEAQIAWAGELERLLKPGGLLVCSTHGDRYRHLLTRPDEASRYDRGQAVIQTGYAEGKKWFLAIQPPRFVREHLLAGFEDIHVAAVKPGSEMSQDLWVARKAKSFEKAGATELETRRN